MAKPISNELLRLAFREAVFELTINGNYATEQCARNAMIYRARKKLKPKKK